MSSTIDLSQLPPPVVVRTAGLRNAFRAAQGEVSGALSEDQREQYARTLELESEPITMILEENCYRELLLRQRVK